PSRPRLRLTSLSSRSHPRRSVDGRAPRIFASYATRPVGVVYGAFRRGAAFLLCVFAVDFVVPTFARARAALLAAARLSGDHGVYRNSGWPIDRMSGLFVRRSYFLRCYALGSIFS